ncbi:MAG: hypothetical protein ACOZIN_05575 [Myxococcota bacterium]
MRKLTLLAVAFYVMWTAGTQLALSAGGNPLQRLAERSALVTLTAR